MFFIVIHRKKKRVIYHFVAHVPQGTWVLRPSRITTHSEAACLILDNVDFNLRLLLLLLTAGTRCTVVRNSFSMWVQVCKEFLRGICKRNTCRFAHPGEHVSPAAADGTVVMCMDSVKGRCNRDPCRYFHPPLHLHADIKASHSVRFGTRKFVENFFIFFYTFHYFDLVDVSVENYIF